MGIDLTREVARADMNDDYGVTVWQERKQVNYTPADARLLAAEIVRAADEAEHVALKDAVHASSGGYPYIQDDKGQVIV